MAKFDVFAFRPQRDPVHDRFRQRPDGSFSRVAWLPTLGPTAWALWIIVVDQLTEPEGVFLQRHDLAVALGLGSKSDKLLATLRRLCMFRIFEQHGNLYDVRLTAPPLTVNQLRRLPGSVKAMQSTVFALDYRGSQG